MRKAHRLTPSERQRGYAPSMRHHSVLEDTREMILAELEQAKADRGEPHAKPERAAELERAIAAVEAGALEIQVKHTIYRIPIARRQYMVTQETRQEVLAELERYQAIPDARERQEVAAAATAVELGATAVFVMGMLYRIVED